MGFEQDDWFAAPDLPCGLVADVPDVQADLPRQGALESDLRHGLAAGEHAAAVRVDHGVEAVDLSGEAALIDQIGVLNPCPQPSGWKQRGDEHHDGGGANPAQLARDARGAGKDVADGGPREHDRDRGRLEEVPRNGRPSVECEPNFDHHPRERRARKQQRRAIASTDRKRDRDQRGELHRQLVQVQDAVDDPVDLVPLDGPWGVHRELAADKPALGRERGDDEPRCGNGRHPGREEHSQ